MEVSADTQRDRGNERGRPRMVAIAKAERIRSKCVRESRIRAAETRKRHSEAAAAAGAAEDGGEA